jgi:hypothetical protein
VFPVRYGLKLHILFVFHMVFTHPCGGGVEYLHRDPASRRRRRKGSLKFETVNYGHESKVTRPKKDYASEGH